MDGMKVQRWVAELELQLVERTVLLKVGLKAVEMVLL